MDNLFSVSQVAYILKVHPLTIRRYIREERLKAVKIGGNIRIRESDLSDFTKDFSPTKQLFRMRKNNPSIKTFNTIDPFFQLQGKGASLDIPKLG
ncbi:MAG: helix-turn-helix domain-containing protein [Candidatus Levybacteria bacterium]|nr:helix-turn-helix domain-containing protein [Candidatus Levybacteria bacterium]MBI2420862.1 helix-turn-helix domain-containing protein [Candidatus Levybacteria bacterium]